jgi:prevent-host-death family protein
MTRGGRTGSRSVAAAGASWQRPSRVWDSSRLPPSAHDRRSARNTARASRPPSDTWPSVRLSFPGFGNETSRRLPLRRPKGEQTSCRTSQFVVLILRCMTPQRDLKDEVGVREFHDHLSRYVRHVAEGGEVVVTMRGRRVARLAPVDHPADPLADLRSRGLVSDPTSRWRPRPRGRASATSPVSDLVADQRR